MVAGGLRRRAGALPAQGRGVHEPLSTQIRGARRLRLRACGSLRAVLAGMPRQPGRTHLVGVAAPLPPQVLRRASRPALGPAGEAPQPNCRELAPALSRDCCFARLLLASTRDTLATNPMCGCAPAQVGSVKAFAFFSEHGDVSEEFAPRHLESLEVRRVATRRSRHRLSRHRRSPCPAGACSPHRPLSTAGARAHFRRG